MLLPRPVREVVDGYVEEKGSSRMVTSGVVVAGQEEEATTNPVHFYDGIRAYYMERQPHGPEQATMAIDQEGVEVFHRMDMYYDIACKCDRTTTA